VASIAFCEPPATALPRKWFRVRLSQPCVRRRIRAAPPDKHDPTMPADAPCGNVRNGPRRHSAKPRKVAAEKASEESKRQAPDISIPNRPRFARRPAGRLVSRVVQSVCFVLFFFHAIRPDCELSWRPFPNRAQGPSPGSRSSQIEKYFFAAAGSPVKLCSEPAAPLSLSATNGLDTPMRWPGRGRKIETSCRHAQPRHRRLSAAGSLPCQRFRCVCVFLPADDLQGPISYTEPSLRNEVTRICER